MYVKIFEGRDSVNSYTIYYQITLKENEGIMWIENRKHESIKVNETELYKIIDEFYKKKLTEQE